MNENNIVRYIESLIYTKSMSVKTATCKVVMLIITKVLFCVMENQKEVFVSKIKFNPSCLLCSNNVDIIYYVEIIL